MTTTLGIMATEDNTIVTISGYDPNCEFRLGNDAGGITDNTLTINLNAGQSYVVEAPKNQTTANIDGWLGATITANKKIAISNGGLNVGVRAGAQSRDAAIDQPVPQNIIGKDYVFVRGNGTDETEFPIIIGTQNGTDIFVNGSSIPIATINNGDYFEIPGSNYSSGTIGANMTVITSKEAYAYQCLAGSSGIQTIGLNFVAPVNCLLPDNLSNIPDIKDVAGLSFTGGITILASTSTPDGNIMVTDGTGMVNVPPSIPSSGLPWKSFFVPNLTGNVSVSSTGPIAVGFIGVNNNAGIAGYFSGFDTVPVVDLAINGGGCLPGSDLVETSGTFDAYQWYKDGTLIAGATNQNYTPVSPGDFFVRVTKGGCTYDSPILSAYNCDPEIVLTKTVDKSNVIEGDIINFKVTVKSLGVNPVNNLVITDLLPAELSFVSATPAKGTWTAPYWNIGQMTNGEVFSITIKAKVNEVSATTTVANTVSNSQTEVEADVITDDDTEAVTITNSGLTVTKETLPADDGTYDTLNELIKYKIVVTNTGDTELSNVTITDPKADTGSISPSSVATLAIGASTTFTATHKITQANIDAGKVINQATAKALLSNDYEISDISDDPNDPNNNIDDPTITPIVQNGKLVLEKTADPADDGLYDSLGEKINYELLVKNTGNVTLNNITITDSNADAGSISPANLTSLAAGASFTFTAKHTIVQADFNNGKATNTATVTGTIPVVGTLITDQSDDPTTIAPNDPTVVTVPEIGKLTSTKVDAAPADGSFDTVGEIITYTIFVTNTGTITLTDLNIVDPNADTITLQSTTGTDTNTTDNRVDSIDPNQTATFIATHAITQADLDLGKVQNRATASALDITPASVTDLTDDPDNPNNNIDDPTITLLNATPSLSITKTVNDDSNVAAGQLLTYTYIVTNNGNVTIDDVTISDLHSGSGTLTTPKLQSTTGTDNDTTDNKIETLAPGQIGTWTATYTVTTSDITNQVDITNTATATGTPKIKTLTNPTATKNTTVHPIETICSDAALAHDLTLDGSFTGASFSWVAAANGDITGASTSPKTTTTINDILVNDSGTDQIMQYNITVRNSSNVIIDTYKYVVTVHSQLIIPDDDSSKIACIAQATMPATPVVTDYSGATITPVITENTSPICEGDKIYSFEYTDCVGNKYTYKYTYTIDLTIKPVVPVDGASTVECLANATTPTPPTTVKDSCGNAITAVFVSTVDSPSSLTCEGTRTYNYSFTDCSGLVSNWKYVYTIDKTTKPVVPVDGASTVECLANATPPTTPTTVKDVCGTAITAVLVTTVDSPSSLTCEGTRTYKYTFTDCSGLVSNWKYVYTIDKTTKPVVPVDGASTVECLANATPPTTPTTVKDVCGTAITAVLVSTVDSPLSLTCEGTRTYNYTFTDCSGLVSNWKYVYTIDKTTVPVIPADGASTVECLASATTPTPPTTVKDVCGTAITAVLVSTVDSPSSLTCEGTRTYNYTDCSGLVSNWKYVYTIDKTTKPVVPADAGSTVHDISKAVQPAAPTVMDKCGNNITPIITQNASPVCDGTKVYTFTYTDCAGNSAVYKYTYQIDVTSTLVISNKIRTTCSNVALNFDLKTVTTLVNPTFQWTATDNPNVSGENNNTGTLLNDLLVNKTGTAQNVKYTIIPFNNAGCQGPSFEVLVTVNPEPYVATAPTAVTCSNIPLNHDLNSDVNVTGATFKWVAISNPNVSGATTTVNTSETITDNLINTSGIVQTVVYKITPESIKGCLGTTYNFTVTVRPEAKLIVTKSTIVATDGAYDSLGELIKYQITVENPNELALTNLTLTDANADANSISPLTIPTVAAFAKTTFTASHTITQADLDAGFVDNSAIGKAFDPCGTAVTDDSDDPSTAAANDITRTPLVQKPLIALEKTFQFNDENGDGIVQNNETITYRFKVINTGNVNLTAIQITDPLITVNGGPINLAPGAIDTTTFFGTYTLNQSVIDSESLTNSATVEGVDPKGNLVSDISDDPKDPTNTDSNGNGNPDDSTVFAIAAKPELTLKKSGVFLDANGDGLPQAGEKIEYTFDINNTGNVTMKGITVSDPLTTVTGGPIDLLPGQTDTTTFTAIYTLSQTDVNAGKVTNTATASGKSPNGSTITDASDDPSTVANNDATVTKLTQDAQITLLKTAVFKDQNGNGFPEVGETIAYTFNVKNVGNVTVTDVQITDPLITVTGGPITLTPKQLDATTFKGSYTLTLNDINTGSVTNSATAEAKDPKGNTVSALSDDPNNPTNVDTNNDGHPDDKTVTKLVANPKLSVSKTGVFNDANSDGLTQVGETISYTFEVKNIGNVTVSAIKITDALVGVNGGPISLNPNQNDSTTFTALYTIKQSDIDAGKVTNTAIASGLSPKGNVVSDTSDDPNNSANQDTNGNGEPDDATVTTLPGKGKISLTKVTLAAADGAYDTVGEKINYQLTITNTGNLTLTNVIVTDANADSGSILPAVITTITPGATATVNAQHTLTLAEINSGSVTNSASVNAKDPFGNTITDISDDPNNATNSDSNGDGDPDDATITLLSQKPSISIEKTFTFNDENKDGFPQLNETITYDFKVTNTGNVTLSNITVTDALVPVLGGPITLGSKQMNNNTFYADYKITQADIDAGAIVNSATVNAKDTNGNNVTDTSDDPNNPTNTDVNGDGEPDDATVTPLARNPKLTITKKGTFIDTNKDGLAQAGETIKYHFDVSNTGNVTISGITVDDALVPVTGGPLTLAPKAKNTTTFQAIYVLTQDDVNAGFVVNSATAIGQDPFGNTITDKSDDPTTTAKNDDTTTSLARESQLSL
ncbi:DUF7507 domain-containing protein [Flavobacterium muglaense]|uniref:DUF11 domain-containing protein n=1 Tax=Flavobacterium muglaense TaxID=2764716 RepID=A0A923MZR2_9FLAO|nr:DUF11 domain-containing protein [Flavobacterium muglaense]MBC5844659.1 DUF11 domain-containing protein [Flavobacterium muglaense]